MPANPVAASAYAPQAEVMTFTILNVYLLLAALAVLCTWTTKAEIPRYYLLIVAFADLGHIYATYRGLGDAFWNTSEWNEMIWGNVGVSAFLHINRLATFFGLYGKL